MSMFSALAEPTRRSIVELLATSGQMTASAICREFPATPSAISQHLKILRQAGLVTVEKQAQKRLYRINVDTLQELETWVQRLHALWNARYDQLDQILKAQKTPGQAESDKDEE